MGNLTVSGFGGTEFRSRVFISNTVLVGIRLGWLFGGLNIGSGGGLVGRSRGGSVSGGRDWDGSGLISGSWDWGVVDDRGMVDGGSMVDGSVVDGSVVGSMVDGCVVEWGAMVSGMVNGGMVEWGAMVSGVVDGGMVSVVDSVSNSVNSKAIFVDGGVTVLVSHGDSHKGRDGHKCL